MNYFEKQKDKLELSFSFIGKSLNPPVNRGTVYKYINNPGKWTKDVIERLSIVLEIPIDKAIKEWTPLRKEHFDKQVQRKMGL